MAEVQSGEIKTNTTYDSFFWVRWSIQKTDKTLYPPVTRINWSCGVTPGHQFYYQAIWMSAVTINGQQVYDGGTYSYFTDYEEHTLGSGELDIPHDTDGTKTFTISQFTGWLYGGYNYTGAETDFTLPKIDTKAIITSADNFNNTFLQPKVSYSNSAGYSFGACIAMHTDSSGTWQADIPESSYIEVGSDKSGTWTFDLTDDTKYPGAISKLKSLTANTASLPFRFYLRTIINNTPLYSHIDKTFTVIKNSKTEPKLYPSITVDDNTWGVTRSNNVFIKGITNIVVNAHPQAQWGASIKSCSIKCGNSAITSQAGELQHVNSGDVTFSATDSRGFTTTTTTKGTLIDYIPVTATLIASNPNGEGEATIQIDGDYFNGSFGVSTNSLTIQYRIKVEDGNYGNWITIPYTPYGNRYSVTKTITGLDYTKKITFQARAYDMLTSAVTDEQARKAVPVFYWGKDSFSFNVPFSGTHANENVGDVLAFAESCPSGVTPFVTNSSSTNIPNDQYLSSTGIVHKQSNTQINVYLKNYKHGTLAINTYQDGTWTGWQTMITMKVKTFRRNGITQSSVNDYWSISCPAESGYTRIVVDVHVLQEPSKIIVKNYAYSGNTLYVYTQNIAGEEKTFDISGVVLYILDDNIINIT